MYVHGLVIINTYFIYYMLRKYRIFSTWVAGLFLMPLVTSAQDGGNLDNIDNLIESFGGIINDLIPIAFALILLGFFWGLAKYVRNADDPEAKKEGRSIMIAGVLALFVAAAIWGIVNFLEQALLGDEAETTRGAPGVDVSDGN